MEIVTHEITQHGKEIISNSGKIVVSQFENNVVVLHFNFDDDIQGNRYIGLLNPESQEYVIDLIGSDDNYIITRGITRSAGIWRVVIMETTSDYIIKSGENFDESKILWISDVASFLFVKPNFLDHRDTDGWNGTLPGFEQYLRSFDKIYQQLETYDNILEKIDKALDDAIHDNRTPLAIFG